MAGHTTNSQNLFLNSQYRENGFKWNPSFQLPSTLISTDQDDQSLHMVLVDVEIPYNVYNIFQYNDTDVYPCAEDGTIDANNNFGIQIWVDIITTNPPGGYIGNIKWDVLIPMGNYNVLDMSLKLAEYINGYLVNEWIAAYGFVDGTGLPVCTVVYNFTLLKYEFVFNISAVGDKVYPFDPLNPTSLSFIDFPYANNALNFSSPTVWTNPNSLQFNRTAGSWLGASNCNTILPNTYAFTNIPFIDNTTNLPAPVGPNESIKSVSPLAGNIGMPRFIGVRLDVLTRNIGHQHGQGQPDQIEHSTLIGKLFTTAPNGDTLKYLNINDDFKVYLPDRYLNDIRISLTDEFNRPIYFQDDWTISIRVDFVQQSEMTRDLLGEQIYLQKLQIMGTRELVQESQKKDKILV